jgi:hypothetical protein
MCANLNQWIGPSDDVRELFYCSKTTCDLRCDLAVMLIRQIRYHPILDKFCLEIMEYHPNKFLTLLRLQTITMMLHGGWQFLDL